MSANHTPGPWTARKAPHGPIDVFDQRGRDLVTVYGGGVESESTEANARLIEAAPELLDVVKRGRQKLATFTSVYSGDKELRELLDAWDAAITKAEGLTPSSARKANPEARA